jgi:hypothetical protein
VDNVRNSLVGSGTGVLAEGREGENAQECRCGETAKAHGCRC